MMSLALVSGSSARADDKCTNAKLQASVSCTGAVYGCANPGGPVGIGFCAVSAGTCLKDAYNAGRVCAAADKSGDVKGANSGTKH